MAFEDRIRLPTLSLIHRRPRLLNMLAEFVETRQRLITIYAPSGYGKSIILADFAQTTDLPVCWCSLGPSDRDPISFLDLLIRSIIDRFREIEPDPLLRAIERGDTQTGIRLITEALSPVGCHIIIIDDYHKAVSPGMTLTLNKLLENLPETATVIVAARGDMSLETGQIIDLLISERATGLSEEELRFNGEEIQRVMRKRFGQQIARESAEEIAGATDGNIAQILLTGHMSSGQNSSTLFSLKQRLGDDQNIIYTYLANEVFDKLSPDLQRFMLYTSVLPDMTVELCNALLEISSAQNCLEEVVRRDLFVSQTGASFKYHDLFAEFLRAKLAEETESYEQIVRKAASLLNHRQRFEEAITLYLSIAAWQEASVLLQNRGRTFYASGRALTLHYWLSQVPEQELQRWPQLLLLQGQILSDDLGELKEAMKFYKQAEREFYQSENLIGAAEAIVNQSTALRMMGQVKESLDMAAEGLLQLETLHADREFIAYALRNRGLANGTAGNITAALLDLRQALALYEQIDDTYRIGMCHHEIGVCLEKQGNLSSADYHYQQALGVWEYLGNTNDLANTLNSLGVCFYLRGNYPEALTHFQQSLEIAQQIGAVRRSAFIEAGIGDTHLAQQDYQQAIKAYAKSTLFAREANVQSLEVYNLVRQGECFYGDGNFTQAFTLASQAQEIAAEAGLAYEQGLASVLQAKIYVQWKDYDSSFPLFAAATTCLAKNAVLEQAQARLWWAYSLLLNFQATAAFNQLQEAIKLLLTVGELIPRLKPTFTQLEPLIRHFLHWPDTPTNLKDNIRLLIEQTGMTLELDQSGLLVFAFGPPTLILGEERKQFNQRGGIRRMPEFLLYLILAGNSVGCRWSEVCAALWPDEKSDKASMLFHQHLKRLRKVVLNDSDLITLQQDYYRVDPARHEWCDALAFERLYEQAAKASPAQALDLWLELIALYRGEFLAGFELGDWGMRYRSLYEDQFLQAVELASEQLLQNGSAGEALVILKKGLAQDYFRESLHRSMLRAYAQLGLHDNLSTHYTELCHTFSEEFDAPPELETNQLYEVLMNHK